MNLIHDINFQQIFKIDNMSLKVMLPYILLGLLIVIAVIIFLKLLDYNDLRKINKMQKLIDTQEKRRHKQRKVVRKINGK